MHNLGELRGQKVASRILEAYLTDEPPPLCILFGPEGTGKWSAAEAFIQQRLCEVGTGCGNCAPCRKFLRGEHPDFIQFPEERVLIGEPKQPDQFTIRWLLQTRICYSPFEGSRRFILFPRADLIQREAESALLKTLEEPPAHTRFVFLVRELSELNTAVISRGVCIPFHPLPRAELQKQTPAIPEEFLDLLGGSFHLLPFFYSDLYKQMKEKITAALGHPQALLELEDWLVALEKKKAHVIDEDTSWVYNDVLEIFGLLLLKLSENVEKHAEVCRCVFEFKEELHREMAGLAPYLRSRLFHNLTCILFPR